MSSRITCDQCGADITALVLRRGRSHAKAHYCNRQCRAEHEQASGHFKAMSEAGREKRGQAVAISNQTNPRRKKATATS